jgi:hypothetical protein
MLPELRLITTQVVADIWLTESCVAPELSMPSRTAKFAYAIFVSLLVGLPPTTSAQAAPETEDECLSSPKDQSPPGSHWYYRIDRATKRQCWYLKEAEERLSQTAAPASSAKPVLPKPASAAQRLMVEARAELPAQTRNEPPRRERPVPADATIDEFTRNARPPAAEMRSPMVASRWLSQADVDPSTTQNFLTSPTPLTGPLPGGSPSNSPAPNRADSNRIDADTKASAVPAASLASPAQALQTLSPVTAGQFTAPDLSPATPNHSVQTLLAAMMGALGLAGLMGRAIFKFVGPRSPAKRNGRKRRGAIWKSIDGSRRRPVAYPGADAFLPRQDFPRDLDQAAHDPDGRIAEFFAKMSHHAPT